MLKLPVLEGPRSDIQSFSHPLTLTSTGHWAALGNKRSSLPGETISLLVLCAAKAPGNIKPAKTGPSQCTSSHLGRVQLRRFIFLVPR